MKKLLAYTSFTLLANIVFADKVPFYLIIDSETAYSCNDKKNNKEKIKCEDSKKNKINNNI
ncbi:hypothetical protein FLM55_00580 [Francisella sp. Scap27]|uniref:hypothetical protein n=1 Tax=Francisella sp. Scap27 TaxID=2589986 RepID=UPI0015BA292B|nr:hypothetical protein [Francisella sp. Scap27]QLE78310.1 hypothetical protein FLM55_00580 [Francisella sp. Scap27]